MTLQLVRYKMATDEDCYSAKAPEFSDMAFHFTVLLVILSCAGCSHFAPQYKTIHVILPNDFHGPFVLVESRDGIPMDAAAKKLDLVIPASGVLELQSGSAAMKEFRVWSASYADGRIVPVDEPRDDERALRGGGYSERMGFIPRSEYFVGTLDEFKNFDFAKWPTPSNARAQLEIFQYPNLVSRRDEIVKSGEELQIVAIVNKVIVIPTKPSLVSQDDTVLLTVREPVGSLRAGDTIRIKFDQFAMSPNIYKEGELVTLGVTGDESHPQLTAYKIKN